MTTPDDAVIAYGRAAMDQFKAQLNDLAVRAARHQADCEYPPYMCPGDDVVSDAADMTYDNAVKLVITAVLLQAEQLAKKDT